MLSLITNLIRIVGCMIVLIAFGPIILLAHAVKFLDDWANANQPAGHRQPAETQLVKTYSFAKSKAIYKTPACHSHHWLKMTEASSRANTRVASVGRMAK